MKNKNKLHKGDSVDIRIGNPKSETIDSIQYHFQGKYIKGSTNFNLSLENVKLGKHDVSAIVYHDGKRDSISKAITVYATAAPKLYSYNIVKTYPHDIKAYTQGLEFHNDTLYESTGQYGKSTLRKVDYRTGEVLKNKTLNKAYFAEGITVMNDKIYQLTWREKTGFIYDMGFKKLNVFTFNRSKEGWGLCNDGKQLYKSDGSDRIWTLDAKTLEEKDYIQICSNTAIFSKANELEWVRGKIFANTYLKDGIMIINPLDGAILGIIDCRGLKEKVKQHKNLNVLNGIAFNPKTETLFVTGKHWDKLFEIEILEK